ncbi:MAG: hypothetical protein AAGB34_09770 [Planctomycetota bacterium]
MPISAFTCRFLPIVFIAALMAACAGAPEPEPVSEVPPPPPRVFNPPTPSLHPFAGAAAKATAEAILAQPAVQESTGPILIVLQEIQNNTGRSANQLDRVHDTYRAILLDASSFPDRFKVYNPFDPAILNAEEPELIVSPEDLLPPERVFYLRNSFNAIERPGTLPDILYYETTLTNKATKVDLFTAQFDSKQYR